MLVCALVTFTGCGMDVWLGGEEILIPGERISVIERKDTLEITGSTQPVNVPQAEVNHNWLQPGGNAANAPVHLATSATFAHGWSASVGTGSSGYGRLTSSPIVIGEVVYSLDAAAHVTAISARDGKQIWRISLALENEDPEGGFGGGLTADFGRIIAATGFGQVIGIDPASGEQLWRRTLGLPIRAAPTASNGRVFVITVNNEVHCLDIETGKVIWDFRRYSESAGVLANTSPAVFENTVVVPYRSGELFAFDVATGKPKWSDVLTRTGAQSSAASINDITGRPVIADGLVFAVSYSGRLVAINLKDGVRAWERNLASTQTPWVAGRHLFVVALDGRITALSTTDGSVKWVTALPKYENLTEQKGRILYSGPILAGGRLILVSSSGVLIELTPEFGAILSQTSLEKRFYIPPVVASGSMYLLSDDATLIAMR